MSRPQVSRGRTAIRSVLALILAGILAGVSVEERWGPLRDLPHGLIDPIKALLVLLVGSLVVWVIERQVLRQSIDAASPFRRLAALRLLVRLGLYLAILLAVVAALGQSLSSLLVGGAFVTVIVGMAGQTFLGNLIAGIGLVIFRPFQMGDHIVLITDAYPVIASTFPHEAERAGYRGTVHDINLLYTHMLTDDGVPLVVPNGMVLQSAIETPSRQPDSTKRVRMRFDVDMAVPADILTQRAQDVLQELGSEVQVEVVDIGIDSYGVAVEVRGASSSASSLRHRMALALLPIIAALKASNAQSS